MTRLLVLAAASALLGCSSAGETRSDPFVDFGEGAERITVAVLNEGRVEAEVTLLSAGARHPLGSLIPQEVEVFEVPWSGLEQARIEVRQVAGERYTTPSVTVRAGTRVDVVIRDDIRRTRIVPR